MTDSQRQLAEQVARWARWTRSQSEWLWDAAEHETARTLDDALSDDALAWRAEEELIEHYQLHSQGGLIAAAKLVKAQMDAHNCDRREATFRALFAAKGE